MRDSASESPHESEDFFGIPQAQPFKYDISDTGEEPSPLNAARGSSQKFEGRSLTMRS